MEHSNLNVVAPASVQRRIGTRLLSGLLGDWRESNGPLYAILAQRLGQMMADGRLAPGTRLPAERGLANELGVSRSTTTRAYALLRERRLLTSRQGSGSTVNGFGGPRAGSSRVSWLGDTRSIDTEGPINLTAAVGEAPPQVAAALMRAAEQAFVWRDHGYHPLGLEGLRDAVARRYDKRGLPTRRQQILITAGAQQAIYILARAMLRRGDVALVESPTYPGALDALRATGARLASFDVAHAGWNVGAIADLARQAGAQLLYTIPDYHNPTGRLMVTDQRAELVGALRTLPLSVVCDETMADLRIDGSPAAVLAHHPGASSVISVGSLSKSVWGGLRIGWIRASERLVSTLGAQRMTLDIASPVLEQVAAIELVEALDELVEGHRDALRQQRDVLLSCVRERLGWLVDTPAGGLSAWAQIPGGSATALADAAPRFGVVIAAGPRLSPDGALDRYVRLPFSMPPYMLVEAVKRLTLAQAHLAGRRSHDPVPLL